MYMNDNGHYSIYTWMELKNLTGTVLASSSAGEVFKKTTHDGSYCVHTPSSRISRRPDTLQIMPGGNELE